MVNVTQYSDVLVFNNTGSVEIGDTLRVNTVEGSTGGITTDWAYFTVSDINGIQVTVDTAADVDFADGYYYAEYGNFYSGPGLEHGVSTNCLQADPDFTNNPLDHDVSASDLQDELQGLAQVNSSAGCLEVHRNFGSAHRERPSRVYVTTIHTYSGCFISCSPVGCKGNTCI